MKRFLNYVLNRSVPKRAFLVMYALSASLCLSAQQAGKRSVSGTVTDENGESVVGASIVEKGVTANGTITNADGKFSLNVSPGATLIVSYIGYVTKEMPTGNQTTLSIVLTEDTKALAEVVVVGYGTQKKETLTGAVAALSGNEMVKTRSNNVQNSLMGRMSGVQVNQRTSEPGTFNSDFSIRGMGTPLVVIDGVPRENITRLDGSEIESVSVLKDASAAVYGSRAANGVVLITTKKGRAGQKFAFEYNGYAGVQNMMLNVELLDAVQYMKFYNELAANSYSNMPYTAAQIAEYESGAKKSSDWLDLIMKESPMMQQHSLSANGSTEKVDYFVNFGYFTQDGWFKTNTLNYERFNLRSNVTARLAKGLKGEIFINLTNDIRNQQPESTWRVIERGAYLTPPTTPVYFNDDPMKPINSPLVLIEPNNGYNYNKGRFIQTNMALEYAIPFVEGLSVRGMYSYDYSEDEWKIFRKAYNTYSLSGALELNTYNPLQRIWWGGVNSLMQLSANYKKTFNEIHNIGATLVYEESDREADNFSAQRNVLLGAVDQLFAADPTGQSVNQETGKVVPREDDQNASRDGLYQYANKGLIGRLTYDYASKYLFEISFRYDGSSRFAPGHQWGLFPVLSAGWRLSEEKFIRNNFNFVNNLKLRGSYGQMGDEGTSTYQFLTGYNYGSNQGGFLFGNSYTYAATSRGMANPYITWSSSTVSDIGLDLELWNGQLGLVADVYQRDRSGLLATRQISLPEQLGANMPQENINSDMTQGFELTLTHRNRVSDLNYNLSAGVFMNRTKRKHVEESTAIDSYDQWRNKGTDRWQNIQWGWGYQGQYTSFDQIFAGPVYGNLDGNAYMLPGDFIYEDWNGDGIVDGNDQYPIAINTKDDNGVHPLLNYNFGVGAEWKGFDVDLLFQGAGMAWRTYTSSRDDRGNQFQGIGSRNSNGFTEFYDRWRRADESNPSKWQEWIPGKYPSAYQGIGQRNWLFSTTSSFWMWNTAYLRLKSVEIGYTLPAAITRKAGADGIRIFLNSYNTFTWTAMPIGDPEVKDGSTYPLSRSFSFGLNVKF